MGAFVLAFPAIFFIVDPFAVVPVFLAMTARDGDEKRKAMALKASLTAAGVLVGFALFGGAVFRIFGVTLPAFRVAGGFLLLLTAIDMLRARSSATRTSPEETAEGAERDDIAVVPLAMPLLAGPGAIATVMVLMSEGHGDLIVGGAVIGSVLLTLFITWLVLRSASVVRRVLGKTGLAVLERVFGLILAAIAVQFMFDGARALWTAP